MYDQIAQVLEKAAAYIETVEQNKEAQIREERTKVAKELAEKIAEATGESLDEDTIHKLAAADKDVLQTLDKLASDTAADEWGQPATQKSPNAPVSGKEAVAAADESFLNFLLS